MPAAAVPIPLRRRGRASASRVWVRRFQARRRGAARGTPVAGAGAHLMMSSTSLCAPRSLPCSSASAACMASAPPAPPPPRPSNSRAVCRARSNEPCSRVARACRDEDTSASLCAERRTAAITAVTRAPGIPAGRRLGSAARASSKAAGSHRGIACSRMSRPPGDSSWNRPPLEAARVPRARVQRRDGPERNGAPSLPRHTPPPSCRDARRRDRGAAATRHGSHQRAPRSRAAKAPAPSSPHPW